MVNNASGWEAFSMRNPPHVLIIGASGRFLAQSAVLAGCQVSVLDLFADEDTRQLCAASSRFSSRGNPVSWARRINALGDLSAIGEASDGEISKTIEPEMGSAEFAIVFSGGGENYPEFFGHGFWGSSKVAGPPKNSIAALLQWPVVSRICQTHQIPTPRSFQGKCADQNLDASTTWLRKRERSGGGLQIQPWPLSTDAALDDRYYLDDGYYLQEMLKGPTISGCFVSCHTDGRSITRLLGACQQLPNQTPDDFRYQGSLGPIVLGEADYQEMERVGRCLASELELNGVWGIDFISTEQGLSLIDINPRVTASAELIERFYRSRQSDFTILAVHLEAAINGRIPTLTSDFEGSVFSKRIVYLESERPLIVDDSMAKIFQGHPWITDIPTAGTEIQPGHPIVTVHAEAQSPLALEAETEKRMQEVRAIIAMKTASEL